MNIQERKDMRDLASLIAGIIQKMGASYGSQVESRYDLTKAVHIMERLTRLIVPEELLAKAEESQEVSK